MCLIGLHTSSCLFVCTFLISDRSAECETQPLMEVISSDIHLKIGSLISFMSWDPSGSRLAVGTKASVDYIGSIGPIQVFSYYTQTFRKTGDCYQSNCYPLAILFSPSNGSGSAANAVLTVLWNNKLLTHYPFVFWVLLSHSKCSKRFCFDCYGHESVQRIDSFRYFKFLCFVLCKNIFVYSNKWLNQYAK